MKRPGIRCQVLTAVYAVPNRDRCRCTAAVARSAETEMRKCDNPRKGDRILVVSTFDHTKVSGRKAFSQRRHIAAKLRVVGKMTKLRSGKGGDRASQIQCPDCASRIPGSPASAKPSRAEVSRGCNFRTNPMIFPRRLRASVNGFAADVWRRGPSRCPVSPRVNGGWLALSPSAYD